MAKVEDNLGQTRWSPPNSETNPTLILSNQCCAHIIALKSSMGLLWRSVCARVYKNRFILFYK